MQLSLDGIIPTEPPITKGSDWLKHPGLRLLMKQHALRGVKTLIVGPRASFEGKAHGYEGIIRMADNGRHPILWLLTYVHELAHVVDDQDRLGLFERQFGRKALKNNADLRWLNGVDAPHGARWTEAFVALADTAVGLGLFPGNETAVIGHARSGRARTAYVQLNYAADPRVRAVAPGVVERPVRGPDRRSFRAGQAVAFDTGPRRHGKLKGTVVKVNQWTCTVETGKGKWRVAFGMLEKE